MRRFLFGPFVDEDLREIRDSIAQDNPEAARRLMIRLVAAFRLLAARPRLGHKRADLGQRALRVWHVDSYLIVYRDTRQPVEIVAVVHGARDVPTILNRRV